MIKKNNSTIILMFTLLPIYTVNCLSYQETFLCYPSFKVLKSFSYDT